MYLSIGFEIYLSKGFRCIFHLFTLGGRGLGRPVLMGGPAHQSSSLVPQISNQLLDKCLFDSAPKQSFNGGKADFRLILNLFYTLHFMFFLMLNSFCGQGFRWGILN